MLLEMTQSKTWDFHFQMCDYYTHQVCEKWGCEQLVRYCFRFYTHLNIMLNSLRASSVTPVVFLWRKCVYQCLHNHTYDTALYK